jgi:hypothetical protein
VHREDALNSLVVVEEEEEFYLLVQTRGEISHI